MHQRLIFRLIVLIAIHCCAGFFMESQAQQFWNPGHAIGTIDGKYHFTTTQVPSPLVELHAATIYSSSITYQWEKSTSPVTGFVSIPGATASGYTIPAALAQTTWYRRKTTRTILSGTFIYSNTIKISVVSSGWEDRNYIREHVVLRSGVTTWTATDQLLIGEKLQTTTYLDGIGRQLQTVSRETATPANATDPWGDGVQFAQYDAYGRQPRQYLPYTTTAQPGGMYKTSPIADQAQYYTTHYNETAPYASVTLDNSPLAAVMNVKKPGTAWSAASGNTASYQLNTAADNVKLFTIAYTVGTAPLVTGTYPANTLFKIITTDEYGKQVIEYVDDRGMLVLKKVQLDDAPADAYTGWICTYSIYDDFRNLRCQVQPEGVKWLSQNNWSFDGVSGETVLAEQCFQYYYDDKGRMTWKKTPGAQPLRMLYDKRDRVVFMQDGNQAALTPLPQWTATLYDELDRPVLSALYHTSKTVSQLQADIDAANEGLTQVINNPNQPLDNLVLNKHTSGTTRYAARQNVELVANAQGNFETGNEEVLIETDGTMTVSSQVTVNTHLNPISTTDLNNAATCTILKHLFYDDYTFPQKKNFATGFNNTEAYATAGDTQPIVTSARTTNFPTGSLTRVLGTSQFLASTQYFDDRGQLVQVQKENLAAGTDITTLQYHFDGRLLSTSAAHSAAGTDYAGFTTLTKYLFDKLGRVTGIQKKFGSNSFKTIASYTYDDMGRLKKKVLSPGYNNGAGLESFLYSFNLHGTLTGINKDYALRTGAYSKWDHFFGLYLGYDNRDNVFAAPNLNGQVTGQLWATQGDDEQRRYDYTYDNAGRLVKADFNQKFGSAWGKAPTGGGSGLDFSVSGTGGRISYDLNGNLLSMLQKGVQPGNNTPVTLDDLSYTYAQYSNKLQKVQDLMSLPAVNGTMGDFKDGSNGSAPDYVYDNNGNVVADLNKNAKELGQVSNGSGIKYNHLDKPEQIRLAGKGTINIRYSADGEKLQRSFVPEPSGPTITTTYIGQYTYQQSSAGGGMQLEAIHFEEGRIRIMTPYAQDNGLDMLLADGNITLPGGKEGVFDYYVMDHLQSVRLVLTEGVNQAGNTATMETGRSALEESIFGQTGSANEVSATRYATPPGWTGNTTQQVSRLGTLAGHNTGPNVLQKVMAGDIISATANYFHQGNAGGHNSNFLHTVTAALLQAITGSGGSSSAVKGNAAGITSGLSLLPAFINAVQPNGSNPATSAPQAFLTLLFFDERFQLVSSEVYRQQVAATVSEAGAPLVIPNVKAPKNGYVYAYLGNQSNEPVYFDDFKVNITSGRILEENHYYAYGLRIATLSSKRVGSSYEGSLKNNYLYQGAFSELDEDIGWTDFALRSYDAQIGRWMQQDPFDEFATPYIGMGADPAMNADPTGGIIQSGIFQGMSGLGRTALLTFGGSLIGMGIDALTGGDGKGALYGAGLGLGLGIGLSSITTAVTATIQTANAAATMFNSTLLLTAVGNIITKPGDNDIMEAVGKWEGTIKADFLDGNGFMEREFNGIFKYSLLDNSVAASVNVRGNLSIVFKYFIDTKNTTVYYFGESDKMPDLNFNENFTEKGLSLFGLVRTNLIDKLKKMEEKAGMPLAGAWRLLETSNNARIQLIKHAGKERVYNPKPGLFKQLYLTWMYRINIDKGNNIYTYKYKDIGELTVKSLIVNLYEGYYLKNISR